MICRNVVGKQERSKKTGDNAAAACRIINLESVLGTVAEKCEKIMSIRRADNTVE